MSVCAFTEINKRVDRTLVIYCLILLGQLVAGVNGKWVADVDSSILNEINQNPSTGYLIQFHAPWCGHCRHFEPVYEAVAQEVQELAQSDDELKNIRVVRIDATVHSDVANFYDIRGFPTVKFIRGAQIIPYENERTKAAVINFLRRVNGPSIRWIDSVEQFNGIRREHDVFFLFLATTNTDESDLLFKEYQETVNRYLSEAHFYATNSSAVQEAFFPTYETDIIAVKKDALYLYEKSEQNTLDDFILKEKVTTFPQVSAGDMYDLVLTKKILVIFGCNAQTKSEETKSQILAYVNKHSAALHDTFQFAWTNDLELLNNVAVWTLPEPLFFLYDSNDRKYGVYPLPSLDSIDTALDSIVANYTEIIQHTGNTWRKRLFRPFWELFRTLSAMLIEAPLLSMLIIGLPSAVLSIVCYCLCCLPNETLYDEHAMPPEPEQEPTQEDEEEEEEKTSVEKKED